MPAVDPPDESGRRWQEGDTEPIPRARDDAPDAEPPRYTPPPRGAYLVVDEPIPVIPEDELAGLRGESPPLLTTRRALPLEDEPSGIVARYLFPTEKFRGEWRRHWVQLAKEITIGIAATFVMGYVTGYLTKHNFPDEALTAVILVYGVVLFVLGWRVADWYYDRFILTNKRVMVVKGIITRNVAMMPLLRVTDMKYVQSPLGRILNYGTFELESAGQDQALRKIVNLPNPNELYLRIVEEMYEPEAVEARLGRAGNGRGADSTDDGT
jgi:membrane protein YdbS with pleckstrin-like domain